MFSTLRFDYRNETYVLNTNKTLFGIKKYLSNGSFVRETLIVKANDGFRTYHDLNDKDFGGIILFESLREAILNTIALPDNIEELPAYKYNHMCNVVWDLMIELKERELI